MIVESIKYTSYFIKKCNLYNSMICVKELKDYKLIICEQDEI